VVLLGIVLLALRTKRVALAGYAAATTAILLAIGVRQMGFLWHVGHLYVALVMGLWLALYYPDRAEQRPGKAACAGTWLVTVLFACQLVAAALAVYWDWRHPYSCGKQAADYIQTHGLETMVIAGDPPYAVQTVSGYVGQPVYYLACGEDGVYASWDRVHLTKGVRMDAPEFRRRVRLLLTQHRQPVLLVLSYRPSQKFANYLGATFVASFEGSQAGRIQSERACREDYWLYRVDRRPEDPRVQLSFTAVP
jgi:hypothetical protein